MVKVGVVDSAKSSAVVVIVPIMYDSNYLWIPTPPPHTHKHTCLTAVSPITGPMEMITEIETVEVGFPPMTIKKKKKIFQPSMVEY